MSWDKILEKISDDSNLVQFVESQKTNSTENVNKINALEKTKSDLLTEVKSFKEGNSLVKSVLGIDQLNEDTLKEALGNKKPVDDKLKAELDNLKGLLDKVNSEKDSLVSEYEGKIQNMALTNNLRDLGIGQLASSPLTEKMLIDSLKNGASLDGDNIVYKKEDGTTAYSSNNTPLTPQQKLEEMKSNPDYAPLFKADVISGGGKSPQGGENNSTPKANLGGNKQDRIAAIEQRLKQA